MTSSSSEKTTRRPFDVDIDVYSEVNRNLFGVRAIVYNDETKRVLPHPSGVYIEPVPVDALTGNAAFDYNRGDDVGFFKVDILTNTTYDAFSTKQELLSAAYKEPDWDLLLKPSVVVKLPHLAKHVDMVQQIAPRSVVALADCLAIIRPGKTHLFDEYMENPEHVRKRLYLRPREGIYFKKSHAISYALMIVAVLNKVHENDILW